MKAKKERTMDVNNQGKRERRKERRKEQWNDRKKEGEK